MRLLKVIFFVAVNASLLKTAKAAETDTARFYFTFNLNLVDSPSKADFVRFIFPPDEQGGYLNVKEYYKNGNVKMIGKSQAGLPRTFVNGDVVLEGNCINYYPNGKRQSVVQYVNDIKEGMEYFYREDGALNFTLKHVKTGSIPLRKALYWNFYDATGNQLCKDGNGEWILYDKKGNIKEQGVVKNGLPDGDWKGSDSVVFPITYTRTYSNGKLLSSTGYDKTGKAYSFTIDFAAAHYGKKDPIYFIDLLHSRLKVPKDANGKKINLDTAHFSFIVEKDGSITNAEFLGNKDPELNNNLKEALHKFDKWSPLIYYGVPLRTKIYFAYKESVDYESTRISDWLVIDAGKGIRYRVEIVDL